MDVRSKGTMETKGKASLNYGDGKSLELPVYGGTIGPDVVDIRALYGKTGMFTYDPGFLSTASCQSNITYIDGDEGVLMYRGYPIEQLAVNCDFLEVCYLLLNGELPLPEQKKTFVKTVTNHTMTPKSLLRKKEASSALADIANGQFQVIVPETEKLNAKKVRRVVFCSGKVYYDIVAERAKRGTDDVAVVRIEQLYPFPHEEFQAQIDLYANAKSVVWAQEEPANQGAWHLIQHYLVRHLRADQSLAYAGRASSASPAVGYLQLHNEQQKQLVDAALSLEAAVSAKEAA